MKAYRGVSLVSLGEVTRGEREAREAIAMLRAEINRTGRADLKTVLDWTASQIAE